MYLGLKVLTVTLAVLANLVFLVQEVLLVALEMLVLKEKLELLVLLVKMAVLVHLVHRALGVNLVSWVSLDQRVQPVMLARLVRRVFLVLLD